MGNTTSLNKAFDELVCRDNCTILDTMDVISHGGKRIAFVVDSSHRLVGVVTDGNIREGILNGLSLSDEINKCMSEDYIYLMEEDSLSDLEIKKDGVDIIPVIDSDKKIIGYYDNTVNIKIPIASPHLSGNELRYVIDAVMSTWISSSGEYVERFEKNFAEYCGTKYAVAVSNGTAALDLALLALGIGKGDEVIVPDLTFAATINAVLHVGATPVIVDVNLEDWCISLEEIEKAISSKTKAIIPVHIYGQPGDMGRIMEIAKKNNIYVVEDCAEAHGAIYNGKAVGSIGDVGCFSFFGNKVITTGEGGMCTTNDPEIAEKIRVFKDHGMKKNKRYYHEVVGYNYRMTNIQAAIGVAQLEHVEDIQNKRKAIEDIYYRELSGIKGIELQKRDLSKREKIVWLVSILVKNNKRNVLAEIFKQNNIEVRNFFYPLSSMNIYKDYVFSASNSVKLSAEGINLPTTLDITEKEIVKICGIMREAMKE